MRVLTRPLTVLARTGGKLAHPRIGGAAGLLAATLCAAEWIVQRVSPDFNQRQCFGLRLAPHWHTIWVAALIALVSLWCVHAVMLFSHVAATHLANRGLWLTLGTAQLGAALVTAAFAWLEIRTPEERFVVSHDPVEIHGETYRAIRIEAMSRRRGRRRPVVAWLERQVGSGKERLRVRQGHPWTTASGIYEISLDRAEVATHGAIVRHGRQRVELTTNQPALAGSDTLVLHGVQNPGTDSATSTPKADISIGGERTLLPLDPEWTGEDALLGLKESPVLVLRAHERLRPTLAWATLASLAVGVLMIIGSRRWWRSA